MTVSAPRLGFWADAGPRVLRGTAVVRWEGARCLRPLQPPSPRGDGVCATPFPRAGKGAARAHEGGEAKGRPLWSAPPRQAFDPPWSDGRVPGSQKRHWIPGAPWHRCQGSISPIPRVGLQPPRDTCTPPRKVDMRLPGNSLSVPPDCTTRGCEDLVQDELAWPGGEDSKPDADVATKSVDRSL